MRERTCKSAVDSNFVLTHAAKSKAKKQPQVTDSEQQRAQGGFKKIQNKTSLQKNLLFCLKCFQQYTTSWKNMLYGQLLSLVFQLWLQMRYITEM